MIRLGLPRDLVAVIEVIAFVLDIEKGPPAPNHILMLAVMVVALTRGCGTKHHCLL
jgi:hypothetical protein